MSAADNTPYVPMSFVRAVVIHHSGGPRSQSFKSIRDYHMRPKHQGGRAFTDIAYHFVITEDGTLHQGRPILRMGAHALGRNADTLGVCVVGDNTKQEHAWLPAQVDTLKRLLAALRMVLPPFDVIRHGDAYREHKTECPGITRKALEELLRA